MKKFETDVPAVFRNTFQKTVVTMKEMKTKVKTEDVVVYNAEVIYSCVMYCLNAEQIDLKYIFKYDLSSVPISLFDKNGDSRLAKKKVDFKNTLKEEVLLQTCVSVNTVVLDNCAPLWSIH